jgi:hypothetical protein
MVTEFNSLMMVPSLTLLLHRQRRILVAERSKWHWEFVVMTGERYSTI